MSKIITNYKIASIAEKELEEKSIDPIIKVPIYQPEEKKIEAREMTVKHKEPKLQLMRNSEGIVVGIEVHCTCDEVIMIKMDYK